MTTFRGGKKSPGLAGAGGGRGASRSRRDLPGGQRSQIFLSCDENSKAWAKEQDKRKAEANAKRSRAAKEQENRGNQYTAKSAGPATRSGDTSTRDYKSEAQAKSSTAKAKAAGVNRGAMERAEQLRRNRPDLAEKVAAGELSETAARRQMKKDEVATAVTELPKDKYRIIYADPPWQYNDTREGLGLGDGATGGVDRASTAAANHFPTMSKSELCALDVKALAASDCVLFCWATFPLLPDAMEVVKAWGFKYKTAFVWHKSRGSFGHYHKANAELLLVCTRGSCTPDSDIRESQVIEAPRTRHSEKPEAFREMIDRMYPHGSRIELFNRGGAPAPWVCWGNESEVAA